MLIEIIICYIATLCFGILFNVPRRVVWMGALVGCLAYVIHRTLPTLGVSLILATVLASLVSATLSIFLAKKFRVPATTFSIPAIIPLVPGSKAYFTMLAFVENDYLLGLELGTETMLQAGAIATGLVFALSIFSYRKGGIGQRYETEGS